MGYSRILAPVDTSDFSKHALRYAAELGRQQRAEVTALTVRPPLTTLGFWGAHNFMWPESPEAYAQAETALHTFVAEAAGPSADIRVLVRDGQVVPEILRMAADWPADLIVMGTHGASGLLDRMLLGSVTEKVLRRTTVPVLTIPSGVPSDVSSDFHTILCAVDRSTTARHALEHALGLARGCRGRLVLAHVVQHVIDEDPQFAHHFDTEECFHEIKPQLEKWYGSLVPSMTPEECTVDVQLRFGKPAPEILAIAHDTKAELIVLGTADAPAMFGSTAHQVVRSADVPVLVVPLNEEPRKQDPQKQGSHRSKSRTEGTH